MTSNKITCEHCGSENLKTLSDTCYDDGTDEPSTSNRLVTFEYYECEDCGFDTTNPPSPKTGNYLKREGMNNEQTLEDTLYAAFGVTGTQAKGLAAFVRRHAESAWSAGYSAGHAQLNEEDYEQAKEEFFSNYK